MSLRNKDTYHQQTINMSKYCPWAEARIAPKKVCFFGINGVTDPRTK